MKTPDEFLDQIAKQVNDLIEQSRVSGQDIQNNVKALIQAQLSKLDVVSREEFDIQQRILEKTRTQIEQLQQQLSDLEKRL
jgi:BMFP domain-containing protein YqiC